MKHRTKAQRRLSFRRWVTQFYRRGAWPVVVDTSPYRYATAFYRFQPQQLTP